jgi:uncharacterized protein (UPF0335 family)
MAKDYDGDDGPAVTKMPSREELSKILAKLSAAQSELAELRGALGADIKSAEEDHGVHRGVIKLVAKLEKMDETKRAEWFAHFDHYSENRDLRNQKQPNLFDDVPAEDDGGPTDGAFT